MGRCVYDNGYACEALASRKCEGCTFKKTRSELIKGKKASRELLEKLPERQLEHIRKKYYDGKETSMW